MAIFSAHIRWLRQGATFTDNRYSRAHFWEFDGGARVAASSSPHVVPVPLSDSTGVDPEEAFVAALSSCHMLWFLSMVAARGFIVDEYVDQAEGVIERNPERKLAITRVTLRPRVTYQAGCAPDAATEAVLHREAHAHCFISNSVRTEVTVEPAR